jgi:hypothetical protein
MLYFFPGLATNIEPKLVHAECVTGIEGTTRT